MTLAEWLATPNDDGSRKRRRDFAALIGVTPTMVTKYADGEMWPGKERVEAIVKATNGAVTANDLLSAEARAVIAEAAQ
jgi:DNA-binding transcriptional regulator YdaS (Cro superfamily)